MALDTKTRILELLQENSARTQEKLAELLDIKQQSVSGHISDLREKGWIEVYQRGNRNISEVTKEGLEHLLESAPTSESAVEEGRLRLHNFVVKYPIQNDSSLSDDWRERCLENHDWNTRYQSSTDSYFLYVNNWKFRVTGENCFVRLPSEIRGSSAERLKERALEEVRRARRWLEERTPVRLTSSPVQVDVTVNQQHLARVRDPFAQLVDTYSSLEPSDIRVYDTDGELRLFGDKSNEVPELEAGNPPGKKEYAEDDIQFLEDDVYRWLVENKEEWRALRELGGLGIDEKLDRISSLLLLLTMRDVREGRVKTEEDAEETTEENTEGWNYESWNCLDRL